MLAGSAYVLVNHPGGIRGGLKPIKFYLDFSLGFVSQPFRAEV